MIQLFDSFDKFENPVVVLCNPDKSQLYELGTIYDRKLELRYNALSNFSFIAPSKVNGVTTEYYASLEYRRLIYIENIGYFMITEIDKINDGIMETKAIKCQSLEVVFANKKLTVFEGTYQFYNIISPSATLIGTMLSYVPGWTAGTIDASLWSLYRTFDVSDTTIYSFLMTDVEQAYQCVFTFDTINKTISAIAAPTSASAMTSTDIFMSFDNLIKEVDITEKTDELVTALNVYGAGSLDILTVNPLGTPTIYNFDYYKTTAWMSTGLIAAIDAWKAKIVVQQPIYAGYLTSLKTANSELLILQAALAVLNATLLSLQGTQRVRIEQGLSITSVNAQIIAQQALITAKTLEITNKNAQIAGILVLLRAINTLVSFASNFTVAQLLELDPFILGSTYQNENFVQTDIMTDVEIQTMAQNLYNQALNVLVKVSTPRYEFEIDSANFVFLKEFSTFISQLQLGSTITLELATDTYVQPVLLGIDLNYDDPTSFKMTFGNRLRLDGSSYEFSDLYGSNTSSALQTTFNSLQWDNWNTNYRDPVSLFIESSLNASLNNVISGSSEEIRIDQNGLRGRTFISGSSYKATQVWLTSNTLAFTKDNWNTASLCLGLITNPTGGSSFGLVAAAIVGNLIAGNELFISNTNNSFILNATGATLTDATFTINKTGGLSRLYMNPDTGIQIQKNVGGTWVNQFSVDSSGNVTLAGVLSAATGTFAGALSAATGTFAGSLSAATGTFAGNISAASGTFSGNIYAANLVGLVTNSKIDSGLDAGKVTTGTMSGNRIYGGTISSVQFLNAANADITTFLDVHGGLSIGGTLEIYGSIYTSGGYGKTIGYNVKTPYGTGTLTFTKGILTNYAG